MAVIDRTLLLAGDRLRPWLDYLPGLGLLSALALIAVMLGQRFAVFEAIVWAILLGMVVRNLVGQPPAARAGVNFASKQLLELSVALLGAAVNFAEMFSAGPRLLLLIGLAVGLGILVSMNIGRAFGLSKKLSILIAVGNSICGNSAIAAVAPTIKAEKKDVSMSIALTAVVGVVVVLTLPLLVPLFSLSLYQYGVLTGTTVYAVPQVVAAGFSVSEMSGEVATMVKLVRVLFLAPVVLLFGLLFARSLASGGQKVKTSALLPWFVLSFLTLGVLRSVGLIPDVVAGDAKAISNAIMIVSMVALGMGVDFAAVRTVGPRVFATVVLSILFLGTLSLGLIFALGIA
ncbi:MAG: YeiH family protein [Chloroflexota bacterium]